MSMTDFRLDAIRQIADLVLTDITVCQDSRVRVQAQIIKECIEEIERLKTVIRVEAERNHMTDLHFRGAP